MSMITNRFKGVRCGLCQSAEAAAHGRTNDHINCLSLPSEYVSFEEAQKIIDAFIGTQINPQEKYQRRVNELDD
jgi:ribose 5-phosphate isomerase B